MNLIDNAVPFLVNSATQSANVIIAGIATKRIYVWRLLLYSQGTVTATIKDETVNLCGPLQLVAQSQVHFALEGYPNSQPWFICTTGDDFIIELDAAVQISGAGLYSIS